MTAQPQVDVNFINEMLVPRGKKDLDPFRLNRLDKSISVFEKHDPIQGAGARIDYFIHINQLDMAAKHLEMAKRKFGFYEFFASSQVRIANRTTGWEGVKEAWNYYFNNLSFKEINPKEAMSFIKDCNWYAGYDLPVFDEIEKVHFSDVQRLKLEIDGFANKLFEVNVSLSTYRKVASIITKTIYENYRINTKHESHINEDMKIFIVYENWTDEEVLELTAKVNEAILAIDDVNFQVEADNIEVLFLNFEVRKLPSDFSVYEDDDSDLVNIVSKRMNDDNEELIKIEVADV